MGSAAKLRDKADDLGAPDAEELIASIPKLARLLSKGDVAKFQKVLDAAVLNPMYEEAYRKAMKKSVIARSGGMVLRDRTKERRARRILDKQITVNRSDLRVRVDHTKMLSADALVPRTDNPDEADYLIKVRQILSQRGVWLRLGQPWEAQQGRDPTLWEFWFSLGSNGETIDTEDAMIDREELLDTTMIGAGYYNSVMTGEVQKKLDRAFDRFDTEYDNGWSLHMELMRNRHNAAPGVARVADALGGAEFPKTSIWDRPHRLRLKAAQANVGGNVIVAQALLLAATLHVKQNALLLAEYLNDTIRGGERALTALKVAAAAGVVADAVLMVVGVGYVMKAVRVAGKRALAKESTDELAERYLEHVMKKHGLSAEEVALPRAMRQPGSTKLGGGMRSGQSAGGGVGNQRWP